MKLADQTRWDCHTGSETGKLTPQAAAFWSGLTEKGFSEDCEFGGKKAQKHGELETRSDASQGEGGRAPGRLLPAEDSAG